VPSRFGRSSATQVDLSVVDPSARSSSVKSAASNTRRLRHCTVNALVVQSKQQVCAAGELRASVTRRQPKTLFLSRSEDLARQGSSAALDWRAKLLPALHGRRQRVVRHANLENLARPMFSPGVAIATGSRDPSGARSCRSPCME